LYISQGVAGVEIELDRSCCSSIQFWHTSSAATMRITPRNSVCPSVWRSLLILFSFLSFYVLASADLVLDIWGHTCTLCPGWSDGNFKIAFIQARVTDVLCVSFV